MTEKPEQITGQFGHIKGLRPGARFKHRQDLRDAGMHMPLYHGIHGKADEGAYSIVMSGGYEDDKDHGNTIIYTGEGGQGEISRNGTTMTAQIGPQTWTRGNAALRTSMEQQKPVRVIRGDRLNSPWAPLEGYRYDGLYNVVEANAVKGSDGYMICQFKLERLPEQPPLKADKGTKEEAKGRSKAWKNMQDTARRNRRFTPLTVMTLRKRPGPSGKDAAA